MHGKDESIVSFVKIRRCRSASATICFIKFWLPMMLMEAASMYKASIAWRVRRIDPSSVHFSQVADRFFLACNFVPHSNIDIHLIKLPCFEVVVSAHSSSHRAYSLRTWAWSGSKQHWFLQSIFWLIPAYREDDGHRLQDLSIIACGIW